MTGAELRAALALAILALVILSQTVQAYSLSLADKNCSDFRSWQEAQNFFLSAGAGDPNRLDTNHNGIACESLPGSPSHTRTATPATVAMTPTPVSTIESGVATATATPSASTATATPRSTATRAPRQTRDIEGAQEPTARPLPTREAPATEPEPDGLAFPPPATPATSAQAAVWLAALSAIDVTNDSGDVVRRLEVGDRVRVIAVGDGQALVALPDGESTGWVRLDPRVQLVAQ